MSHHRINLLRRIVALPLFLKSTQSRILHPSNLRQRVFVKSLFDINKFFSSSTVLNSKMPNCGAGDVNECLTLGYDQLLTAQKDTDFLIIDVREHSEINKTGALPGSIHIPMNEVANELTNLTNEEFCKKYNRQLPSKETKLVFSCMSGKRSSMVQDSVQKLGYKNAYNYKGGWSEWEKKQKCC